MTPAPDGRAVPAGTAPAAAATPAAGDPLPSLVVPVVDEARMKVLALLLHDPNPIHFDPASVVPVGDDRRLVTQGPLSLGYLATMLAAWAGDEDRVVALDCRYLANVHAGDAVVAGGEVASVGTDAAGRRVAHCSVWLDVRGGARAVQGTATVLLDAPG